MIRLQGININHAISTKRALKDWVTHNASDLSCAHASSELFDHSWCNDIALLDIRAIRVQIRAAGKC